MRCRSVFLLSVVLGLLFTASLPNPASAAPPPWTCKIKHKLDLPKAEANGLVVQLEFVNDRPIDKGGDDIDTIGRIRGGVYNPFEARNVGEPVDEVMERWIRDVLESEGYRVTRDRDAPRLVVLLEKLWMDGYVGYHMDMIVRLELRDGRRALWSETVEGRGKTASGWGKVWPNLVGYTTPGLTDAIGSDEFRDGAEGKVPPPPPSRSGGCGKDTDCKGDRICEEGRCVSP
jgi:hypothetical protein